MPAKINITKNLFTAFQANSNAIAAIGIDANMALFNVCPDGSGIIPKRTFSRLVFKDDRTQDIELGYRLENIPAHGEWFFRFTYRTAEDGIVYIQKTTARGIYSRTCNAVKDDIYLAVQELAEM